MIETIYYEEGIKHHHRVEKILKRFSNARKISVDRYGEVFNRRNQNFRLQKLKPALILAKKHEGFVLPVPPGFGIGGTNNFYFSHMYNCMYDCRYCFLQGMYSSANYVLFVNYEDFENNIDILSSNIACTVLKVQEKKTQKGSSYAIVKFSDLSNVFELFIFSDIFESNRENLFEGNSLMITLIKNYVDDDKSQRRINVKKMISLKELTNKQLTNITFKFDNIEELKKIKNLNVKDGKTDVNILLDKDNKIHKFQLKDKRKVNNQLLNSLNLLENVVID